MAWENKHALEPFAEVCKSSLSKHISSFHFLYTLTLRYQDEIDRSSQFYSSRLESDERGRGRERGRDRREKCRDSENGRSSRRRSAASLHTQVRCSHCRHVYHKQLLFKKARTSCLFNPSKTSESQSGKHRSSKVNERPAPPERLQTQVSTVSWLPASVYITRAFGGK